MRLKQMFAIRFKGGDTQFWVKYDFECIRPNWEPVDTFEPGCLMTESQANAFIRNCESRYQKFKVKLDAFPASS